MPRLDTATIVHRHSGENWYLQMAPRLKRTPVKTQQSLETFLASPLISELDAVYVAGLPTNSSLICGLTERQLRTGRPEIRVCSPLVFTTSQPGALLIAASKLPPAFWPRWTEGELRAFAAASAYREFSRSGAIPASVATLGHPVQNLIKFFRGGDDLAALAVITAIAHPAWYCDEDDAKTTARRALALGLWPDQVARIFYPNRPDTPSFGFDLFGNRLLQACIGGPFPGLLPEATAEPQDFFLRLCCNQYKAFRALTFKPKSSKAKDLWVSCLLQTASLFIEMLCQYWQHTLRPCGDGLFVPKYFFSDKATADAVTAHLANFRG